MQLENQYHSLDRNSQIQLLDVAANSVFRSLIVSELGRIQTDLGNLNEDSDDFVSCYRELKSQKRFLESLLTLFDDIRKDILEGAKNVDQVSAI